MDSPPSSAASNELFAGSGESAASLRATDWAATPMGPVESWPRSLRAIVPAMLASRCPMSILWGPAPSLLCNDGYRPIHGSCTELIKGPLLRRVQAGESVALEDSMLPLERNGVLEERYFTLFYSPLRDDEGKIGGVLGILHETTAQVLARRRLATLRELASGFPSTSTAQAVCERAAAVLAKNPSDVPFALFYLLEPGGKKLRLAGQTGLEQVPAAAQSSIDFPPEKSAGWPLAEAAAANSAQVVPDLASRFEKLVAGPFPESIRTALVVPLRKIDSGRLQGFFIAGQSPRQNQQDDHRVFFQLVSEQIGRDVSDALARTEQALERQEAETGRVERARLLASEQAARAELERSSHAKDEFLSLVSHELRNPLSAMLGWTRLLRTGKLSPAKRDQALETIERNAMNQSQLIEDLLDVSRIISGKLRLEVQRVDFVESVRAAIDAVRPALEAKRIQLEEILGTQTIAMQGDGPRLQQIVWNLLSNAAKFTPEGGTVRVVLKREEAAVELSVIDSGVGMAPAFLPHVFVRFRPEDVSSTRKQGGLGLGLSIARNLVEMHGGTIRAESGGEGAGSAFFVRLPVSATRDELPVSTTGGQKRELEGLRVLLVDDEPDAREVVAEFLEKCGAQVVRADSAQAALRALDADRPDVILSDIRMPGEDGLSLIRKIRGRPPEGGGATPAASMTGSVAAEEAQRALVMGFNIHLQKPVAPDELVAVVASLAKIARQK